MQPAGTAEVKHTPHRIGLILYPADASPLPQCNNYDIAKAKITWLPWSQLGTAPTSRRPFLFDAAKEDKINLVWAPLLTTCPSFRVGHTHIFILIVSGLEF
ncbi:hypothetical protein TWF751_009385 [Orbilia oligospora]|nr:hypothetical protein TWF751_009385 [Orbilia oligospora]